MANSTVNRLFRSYANDRNCDEARVTYSELQRLSQKAIFATEAKKKLLALDGTLLLIERRDLTRLQRRNLRELERKICAAQKVVADHASETKFRRSISVSMSRKGASKLQHDLTFGSDSAAESQSGLMLGAMAAAGAASLGVAGFNAASDLKRGVDAVVSIAERLESPVADACAGINSIANGFKTAKSPFEMVSDYIRKSLDDLKTKLLQWWKPICALIFIGLYVSYSSVAWFGTMISALFASMIPDVFGYVSSWFETKDTDFGPDETVEAQGGIDLLSYAATIGCCAFVPSKDPAVMAGEVMRRVGMADRSISGFTSIMEKGLGYLEKIVNCILSMFSDKHVQWTSQLDKVLSKWSTQVDDFEKKCIAGNPSMTDLQKAMALMQEGVGLRQVIKSAPNAIFLGKYMDRLGGAIAAHRGAISAGNAFRMQPLTTMLGGGSGVGKTTVLKWLASSVMILTEAVPAEEVLNNMWQKGLSEFWNGYVQQFCYVMDDCFQQKTDGKQLDNEAMFLIRAVGNWAFPLNFADVDSKGRFYFNSPLIMGTTNVSNIKDFVSNLVAEPTAVVRRIEYGNWVFVHPSFQKGTGLLPESLDYAKVEEYYRSKLAALTAPFSREKLLECIPWHAWQLAPHDFSGAPPSRPCENTHSLLDLAKEMSAEYLKRAKSHTNEVEDLRTWSSLLARGLQGAESQCGEPLKEEFADCKSYPEGVYSYGVKDDWENDSVFHEDDNGDIRIRQEWRVKTFGQHEEAVYEARLEREVMTIERRSWLKDAMRGISNFFSKYLPCLGDVVSFVIDPLMSYEDKSMKAWCRRLLSLGIISAVFAALVIFIRGVVDITKLILQRVFGAKPQSNTTTKLSKSGKNDVQFPRLQSGDEAHPKDVVVDLCYNNTYKILLSSKGEMGVLGQVLFIEGNLAMMPLHFWRKIEDMKSEQGAEVVLISVYNTAVKMSVPVRTFLAQEKVCVAESDLMFFKMDRRMLKAHRSIVHFFMTEDALKGMFRNTRNEVRLDVAKIDSDLVISRATYVSGVCEYMPQGIVVKEAGTLKGLCKYTAPTTVGDCGAPLSLFDAKYHGNSGLIGIHVAGKAEFLSRSGFAVVVSRELVSMARSNLGTWSDPFHFNMGVGGKNVEVANLTSAEEQMLTQAGILSGSFLPIGKVDKPVNIATKSKIKKSPMQQAMLWGPSPTAPAVLYPKEVNGTVVYPMAKAMEAYQSSVEFREVKNFEAIVEMATKPFMEATRGFDKSILTFEEAIAPPPHLKLKAINRKTSPGYPHKLGAGAGKTDWFGKEGDFDFSSEKCAELRKDVDTMLTNCIVGVRPAVVCMDFLKDELRPLKKVEDIATRAISGSPLDYVVLVRMYFGAFMAAMFSSCVDNGLSPGINPYTDWHVLAEKLTSKGGKVFAGDFSRFDASEQPYVMYAILDVVNRWYKENNSDWSELDEEVRTMLWLDLVHSRHLTGTGNVLDTIVQWSKSLPSGHPLTTMVNSFYSLITLTACYAHLTGDYKNMWEHVFINTFGDDNVVGADDETMKVFNQMTVSGAMKDLFNLKYTSDKKDADLVEYETINDITFLKRSFKQDEMANGGWIAPLDPKSFLFTPYWFKNPRDVVGDLSRNVEQMLSELSLHEPAMWDEYYPLVEKFFSEEGIALPFRTRDAAYQWVQSRNDAWY